MDEKKDGRKAEGEDPSHTEWNSPGQSFQSLEENRDQELWHGRQRKAFWAFLLGTLKPLTLPWLLPLSTSVGFSASQAEPGVSCL